MISQNDQILTHLMNGYPITPIEALQHFGCFRLAARIKELRDRGYHIEAEKVERNGKQIAEYYIPTQPSAA